MSVLLGCFIFMTYQSRQARSTLGGILSTTLYRIHSAAESVSDFAVRPFKEMSVREADLAAMRKRVQALEAERDRYQETLRENRRLSALLKLREIRPDYVAAAKVVARGIDRWSNVLVLDKGANDGIAKDMVAITPNGLAGKIMDVSDSYSNLLLVTDIKFAAAVRIQESRQEGVLSGTGNRTCLLKYISFESEAKVGDVVITSGLDSLFPPGISVGFISAVDAKRKGGSFQHIEVTPYQDGSAIEEVMIIK